MISTKDISQFIYLTFASGYNEERKETYRLLGKRILSHIVSRLGLQPGQYEIRWNPGGIACSGDHILHTEKFYLSFCDNVGLGGFYWRTCKGMKDYCGGANQILSWSFVRRGLGPLIQELKIAQDGETVG